MTREYQTANIGRRESGRFLTGGEGQKREDLLWSRDHRFSMQAHASILNLATGLQPSRAGGPILQLQRQYGNRYVRRVVSMAAIQRDDNGDDQQKPAPLVGQDRAIDPKDNLCSLQWTLGGPQWLLPSGVSCDPGVFGIPGHGDPFKYPSDQPSATPTPGPTPNVNPNCPGRENPAGGCCPEGQSWGPAGCTPMASPALCQSLPAPPDQFFDNCGRPNPAWTPPPAPPSPGDYNVPDQDSNVAVA
jgi:hypothetical protein